MSSQMNSGVLELETKYETIITLQWLMSTNRKHQFSIKTKRTIQLDYNYVMITTTYMSPVHRTSGDRINPYHCCIKTGFEIAVLRPCIKWQIMDKLSIVCVGGNIDNTNELLLLCHQGTLWKKITFCVSVSSPGTHRHHGSSQWKHRHTSRGATPLCSENLSH